jgi:hypothetical protein
MGLLAAMGVVVVALPASVLTRFLPPVVQAEDLSGSVWHGSAGRLLVNGRDAGAVEWRLHPAALLHMTLAADLHWVRLGFVIDGAAEFNRQQITASAVRGGGPMEDLRDLGITQGLRGTLEINLDTIKADLSHISAAAGYIKVSDLASPQIGGGTNLGAYVLQFSEVPAGSEGGIAGQLTDLGGPVQIQATVTIAPDSRSAMLSGTMQERAEASEPLRNELNRLAQLGGRDPQGRIPIELEFTF